MYVSEICAEGIFVTFPWWLKNVKSRSKIALFSNERHFEIWFSKKKTTTYFWSKLSKLHKKDPILHVATTFSLKQGETRTSHGPIPHPLIYLEIKKFFAIKFPEIRKLPENWHLCSETTTLAAARIPLGGKEYNWPCSSLLGPSGINCFSFSSSFSRLDCNSLTGSYN